MARRKVFISYAHADAALVRHDAELLRAGGVDVFIDVRDIDYGTTWREALIRAIDACERVMVFWSAAARVSEWVDREWRLAVERGKKVVPTLLDETPLPRELAVFQALKRFAAGRLAAPVDGLRPAAASPPPRRSRLALALGAAGGGLALVGVAVLVATPPAQQASTPARTAVESRQASAHPASSAASVAVPAPAPSAIDGRDPAVAPARPASVTVEELIEALRRGEPGHTRSFRTRRDPEADTPLPLSLLAIAFAAIAIALLGWARWQARLRRELDRTNATRSAAFGDAGRAAPAAGGPDIDHDRPAAASTAPGPALDRTRLARAYTEAVFAV